MTFEVVAPLRHGGVGEQVPHGCVPEAVRVAPQDHVPGGQRRTEGRREKRPVGPPDDADGDRPGRPQPRDRDADRRVVAGQVDFGGRRAAPVRSGSRGKRRPDARPVIVEIEERPRRRPPHRCRRRRGLRRPAGLSPGLGEQAAEPELREEGGQPVVVGLVEAARLPGDLHRHRRVEADELAARPGGVGVRHEVLSPLRLRHLAGAGEKLVKRAEPLQQLRRRLRPDSRHARHVVHRIADEREEVHDLVGPDAPLRRELVGAQRRVGPEVQEPHAVAEQLPRVLVGGGDRTCAAGRHRPPRERGEDVVGLVARHLQARHAHDLEQPPHERDLRHEVGRHLRAGGLVVGEPLVPERGPGRVHRAEEMVGLLLADDVEQVAGEAVDGRHGRAVGRRHLGQRVEELVDPRQRVDREHGRAVQVGIGSRGRIAHAGVSIAASDGSRMMPQPAQPARGCPHPLAGRSRRPSWTSLARRRLRSGILACACRLRRLEGMGSPEPHPNVAGKARGCSYPGSRRC